MPGLGIIILHFVEKVVNFNFLIVLGVSVLLAQLHSTQQQQIDLTTTDVGIYCPWFPSRSNICVYLYKDVREPGPGAGAAIWAILVISTAFCPQPGRNSTNLIVLNPLLMSCNPWDCNWVSQIPNYLCILNTGHIRLWCWTLDSQ